MRKWPFRHVHPVSDQYQPGCKDYWFSLHIHAVWAEFTWHSIDSQRCGLRRLIKPLRCTGWSESLVEAHIWRYILSLGHSYMLTLSTLAKFSASDKLKYFSYSSQKTGFDISCKLSPMETICMKYQSLFSGKNINLSSAELANRVVMVNHWRINHNCRYILIFFYYLFSRENRRDLCDSSAYRRWFTWNAHQILFSLKNKKFRMSSDTIYLRFRVKPPFYMFLLIYMLLTLVISTSLTSNNHLSRSENLVPA